MTVMTARYAGKCSATGARIRPGDTIDYDRRTRTARLVTEPASETDSDYLARRTRSEGLVSHVFNIGGNEYYRNKRGRCEDAPCCGCCTI